jgi:hypothetical protein
MTYDGIIKKGEKRRKGKFLIPEIQEIKKHSREDWIKSLNKAFQSTKGQMDKVFQHPSSVTALQLLAMALVTRAITGDTRAAEFCVSWIAGKVPDVTIHKDKDEQTLAITSLGAELIQMVKDKDAESNSG